MTHRQLRDYQLQAIDWLRTQWASGRARVPMVLATGLGKTEIFTDPTLLDEYIDAGKRVLFIAHTDELIEQAAAKARRNNPGRRVGIVKAGQNETIAQIVVSSRQTLGHSTGGPRRLASLRNVGLIVVDEAHHATRTNTYGKILDHFGCFGVDCAEHDLRECMKHAPPLVAGFTATLARGDKQKLSAVWGEEQPFVRDTLFGIRRGYLLDVRGERIVVPEFNMGNVRQSAGDYRDGDIADELERTFAPEIVAAEYAARCVEGANFRKGIAFWPLVSTAEHGAKAFNDAGIRSEVIHGELPKLERRAMLRRLHTGETRVIHGVGVLTEGFDEPTCDVVVIARPTRSGPLYQQMVGRVLRPDLTVPAEHRGKALILDVVGAGAAHDLRSLVDLAPDRDLKHETDEGASLLELDSEYQELLDAWEEEHEGGQGKAQDFAEDYVGPVKVVEFDPLGRDKVWAQTNGGAWLIPAGSVGYVFVTESLAGDPGNWDVIACSKVGYVRDGVQPWAKATEHVDLPMDLALAEAEVLAIEMGGFGAKSLTSKKSKWRNDEPSAAQKSWATRNGIEWAGKNKGELNDLRNKMDAARRIDPLVRAVRAMAESQLTSDHVDRGTA